MTDEKKQTKEEVWPPLMSDKDLNQFVVDFITERVFTSAQVPPESLKSVFMMISLGSFSGYSKTDLENIGLIWEYTNKGGPLAVNGMPVFLSLRVMHKKDWIRAHAAIIKKQTLLEDVAV